MAKIDAYEQDILKAFEKGHLRSVATKGEVEKLKAAARATAVKDCRVNIRLSSMIWVTSGEGAGRRYPLPDPDRQRPAQIRQWSPGRKDDNHISALNTAWPQAGCQLGAMRFHSLRSH
jgi:hypothetical protein